MQEATNGCFSLTSMFLFLSLSLPSSLSRINLREKERKKKRKEKERKEKREKKKKKGRKEKGWQALPSGSPGLAAPVPHRTLCARGSKTGVGLAPSTQALAGKTLEVGCLSLDPVSTT